MYRETQTKAWCANCRQYQPTATKKVICGLPGILLINSGAANSDEAAVWRQNGPNNNNNNPKSPSTPEAADSEQANEEALPALTSWLPER
jgi:PAB-dependent poly(A)-specific ribonuclease subunit 2